MTDTFNYINTNKKNKPNHSTSNKAKTSGQNDETDCGIITKDNIFACNLKFSNLFLNKTEREENDNDFMNHFEQLKQNKQDKQDHSLLSTNFTEINQTVHGSHTNGEKGGDHLSDSEDINNDLIKLIDSPSKFSSKASPLKGKKIIIAPNNSDYIKENNSNNNTSNTNNTINSNNNNNNNTNNNNVNNTSPNKKIFNNFNNNYNFNNYPHQQNVHQTFMHMPHLQNMNMPIQNNIMVPHLYHQNSLPLPNMPFQNSQQPVNNFYRNNNNYINTLNNINGFPTINTGIIEPHTYITNLSPISSNGNHSIQNPPEVRARANTCTPDFKEYKDGKQVNLNNPLYQRYTEMTEEELIINSKELSKDQGGCRFLQKLLENSPKFSKSLYTYLEADFIELLNDSFGNYLIQKLIEKLPSETIDTIITNMGPQMFNIGTNPHGTRVLQKLIEIVKPGPQQDRFIKAFTPCVIKFCNDINGNHIIQKFISSVPFPKNQFIFDIIQKNIILVGLNKHGCCALQKCIEYGTEKQREDMINVSIKHSRSFLTDQYGNYVLQNIISYQNFTAIRVITESFLKEILKLSKEKFSSNVIEKCMDYCDEETKEKILKKLANPEYIPVLLMDMYGNYVIQKALQISYEPYYSVFIENIGPVLENLRNLSFGAKLYTKFLNNYPEFSEYVDENSQYYDDYYEYKK